MSEVLDTQDTKEIPNGIDNEPKRIAITDLDQFIGLLVDWHNRQVATVKHLLEVPAGIQAVIEGEEPFNLEGDALKGYKMGIGLALNYLGVLPFQAEYADEQPAQPTQH